MRALNFLCHILPLLVLFLLKAQENVDITAYLYILMCFLLSMKMWSIRICFLFIQVSPSISTEWIIDDENPAAGGLTDEDWAILEEWNAREEEGV
jgi:hypothetical protein